MHNKGNKYFLCAKDICKVLEMSWSGATLKVIPNDWRVMIKLNTTPNQVKSTTFLNQKAVMKLAFRSNKPEADKFVNWICEILDRLSKGKTVSLNKSLHNQTFTLPFHSSKLKLIKTADNQFFFSPRNICNNLGIPSRLQFIKIHSDAILSSVITICDAAAKKRNQTIFFPLNKLNYFLEIINLPKNSSLKLDNLFNSYRKDCFNFISN